MYIQFEATANSTLTAEEVLLINNQIKENSVVYNALWLRHYEQRTQTAAGLCSAFEELKGQLPKTGK